MQFVYPVKYIFFTTGYTTGYGLLDAFVACCAVWPVGSLVSVPAFEVNGQEPRVRVPRVSCALILFKI